ncbi:MAG: ABC transporter ATP-binding protein [Hyphomicrobiales bacterium]|nr:MAG: ABC transporter ATP-binding protein [Hyphomicrobiales bacterium]
MERDEGVLLKVDDLRVSFDVQGGSVEAVKGISFEVKNGSVLALVGESGSGKSVISQAILRILPDNGRIDSGKILFCDPNGNGDVIDLAAMSNRDPYLYKLRGGRISMVFQEPMTALSPLHTIGNQVEEALTLHHKKTKAEAKTDTEEVLKLVGFPDPARAYEMYSFELSGGLRQRAVIAMALICNPAMVIADEPTTALDVTVQAQILGLMKELQKKFNMAILLITHDLGVVANMADEVVVIYHGEVMEAGTVDDIFNNPQHPYLKALMAAIPHFDMAPGERLVSLREMGAEDGVKALGSQFAVSREVKNMEGPHLQVTNLRKEFTIRRGSWFGSSLANTIVAVDNVSLEVKQGECLGLVGESGSGKTTVAKLVIRALEATSGEVKFNSANGMQNVLELNKQELLEFRKTVQMIFQDPFSSLNPRMTVQNILREPFQIHRQGIGDEQRDQVVELMKLVGLDPRFLNRYPHSFSGGQRQRIGIARALALHPEMLICDEPVSALDVSVQAQILNLLNDLRKELGLSSLFISHNLAVVNYVADRIAVMCRGKIVEIASCEELFENPTHPYTKSLLASVPYPDLDRLLDFEEIMKSRTFDITAWGGAFSVSEGGTLGHIKVGDDHFVLANENCDRTELSA